VLIGGGGRKRTPELAARYADEFNLPFGSLDDTAAAFGRVRAACEAAGRTAPMTYSVAQTVCCGRTDAEARQRASAIGRDLDELRGHGLAGTTAEVADRIGEFAKAGAERVYLQVLDLDDLDHLEVLAGLIEQTATA
jgi:alkanesulfonate monooxygenase SsuD/methylene tetrahydromethanopterin reductase-like flavin-dependent oxidoreductase (luciferase family)